MFEKRGPVEFGIGRFSLWQSWLTQASRLANSQASASNAGVQGDPNSPESNYSYLALILAWLIYLNVICNVGGVERNMSLLNEI